MCSCGVDGQNDPSSVDLMALALYISDAYAEMCRDDKSKDVIELVWFFMFLEEFDAFHSCLSLWILLNPYPSTVGRLQLWACKPGHCFEQKRTPIESRIDVRLSPNGRIY